MPETTIPEPAAFVSHSELIAGLKRLTDATTEALLLSRTVQAAYYDLTIYCGTFLGWFDWVCW
jgi:hypothetical protein